MRASRTKRVRDRSGARDGSGAGGRASVGLTGEPLEPRLALAGQSLVPAVAVPGSPLDVRAVGGNANVAVSWTPPASNGGGVITDYLIEYSRDGGGSWNRYDDGNSAVTRANVAGLPGGTAYQFRVAAVNVAGTSAASAPSPAVTPRTVPGAASNVVAAAVVPVGPPGVAPPSSVSVTWSPPASDGGFLVTRYFVECSRDAGSTWQRIPEDRSGAVPRVAYSGTSASITGLPAGVGHVFRVTAMNFAGRGPASVASSEVVPFSTPSAPTGLWGWSVGSRVNLAWTAPAATGGAPITDYVVEYRGASESTWTTFADGTSARPLATVAGLVEGKDYVFRVSAVNRAGPGAASIDSQRLTPRPLPDTPTGLSAQFGDRQVSLSWTAPADTGGLPITRYVVQYLSRGRWVEFRDSTPTPTGVPPATSATVTGLTNGFGYTFRVAAVNAAGTGRPAWSQVVTPRTTPGAPSLLAGRELPGAVLLTWRAPSNGGSTLIGYSVEYSEDDGRTWTEALANAVPQARALVSGLTNGQRYVFRVSAINAVGVGIASAVSVPLTPRDVPGAPQNVVATANGAVVTLDWQAPASDGGAAIDNYLAWFSTDGGATWIQLETRQSSEPTGSFFGLERYRDLSYVFRVAAVNDAGLGAFSLASAPLRFAVL